MPNENKCCSKCFREGEVVITCGCPCHDNASGSIGIGGDKAFGASRGSSPTKTTEEMEENLSTPEKISNQEIQRFEETSKGLNELRNQITVEERGEGKAKIPPNLPSWEKEFEKKLSDFLFEVTKGGAEIDNIDRHPRVRSEADKLKSFIRSLLSSHIPLEEVVGMVEEEITKRQSPLVESEWNDLHIFFDLDSEISKANFIKNTILGKVLSSLKQKLEERRTNQK